MYLKELTLRGFKSFASATTLRFEPGITAVVGPNGSGKSNIVDALAWVMGEQGAKALRGTQMEDVIFAGTSSRPPLGRAQVSLTIDNTDRALDIDYTEVTISRTIFRNGGSEYAINGSPCRLLDIQELLSDTGLGQQMHVIVGQGRLDAILRADPQGHRAFIEEAAGILKHRRRKERALRKLANTEANLARLDDLLGEIRRQMGPLGRQARISRRAETIQATVRDARSRLYAEDALTATRRRDKTRAELGDVRASLASARRELADVRARIERTEAQAGASSPAIARANDAWHRYAQLQERCRSLAQVAAERVRSLEGRIVANPGEDPQLLANRADELDRQAAVQRDAVADARLALDRAAEARAADERRLAVLRRTIADVRAAARERDTRVAGLNALVAREESAVALAETRSHDCAAQRDDLARQLADARMHREELERELETAGDDDGRALDEARAALAGRQETLDALLGRQRELNGSVISLKAKADALADALDGRNATVGFERDGVTGVLGRLADAIRVEDGWEEGVAHALGETAGAMVVADAQAMIRALDRAREDRLGRAVLLAARGFGETADGNTANDDVADDDDSIADNGSFRSLAALVSANPDADDRDRAAAGAVRAVRSLLAGTAAVESLDEARAAIDAGWRRAATRNGEVLDRWTASGGSSLSQSDLSLAARRDRALKQAAAMEAELRALDDRVDRARADRNESRLAVDRESSARTEARLRARQVAQSIASAADRMNGIERRIKALDERIAGLDEERDSHRAKLADLRRALDAAADDETGQGSDSDELGARESALETTLAEAREREITAKIAWTEATRKADSLERQAGLLHDQSREAAERRARMEALNADLRERAAKANRIAADATELAGLAGTYIAEAAARRDALQAEAAGRDGELKALRAERDRIEPQVAGLAASEHELDVERERVAGQCERIAQKVSDELGMGVEELVAQYGPDRPVPVTGTDDGQDPAATVPYDRAEQQKRLDKALRELAALGKVNPLATEEYEALETRNQYLNDQRDDVVRSRDDLMGLVKDLDATMVEVFRSAFDDTAKAFERMFAMLFPGGRGRLRLENPDDPLTTGVLVEASPAGKRVRQLSLLSGGERSLTALALLFSIFTARPSPFYVMDEVEAALDDVNLTRLLDALEDLRSHAQLIVITHQQRTMSIADALYGVTMRADGITAVVSQRLGHAGDDQQAS